MTGCVMGWMNDFFFVSSSFLILGLRPDNGGFKNSLPEERVDYVLHTRTRMRTHAGIPEPTRGERDDSRPFTVNCAGIPRDCRWERAVSMHIDR